jgi:hypothetical protein
MNKRYITSPQLVELKNRLYATEWRPLALMGDAYQQEHPEEKEKVVAVIDGELLIIRNEP